MNEKLTKSFIPVLSKALDKIVLLLRHPGKKNKETTLWCQ